MARIQSRREKPKAIKIVSKKGKHEPKAIEAQKEEKAEHMHKEAETHHRHGKDDLGQLKDIIVKYFSILPFVRKQELANLIVNPDEAISQEIHTTSIARGYKDYVVPALFIAMPLLILYSLFVTVISLGSGLPVAGIICVGGIVAVPVLIFISQLFMTLALFIFSRLLGGKGSFVKMMGVFGSISGATILLSLPIMVLSFIPCIGYLFQFIGMIVSIYQLYLIYRLNVHLHGLSTKNAILAIVLPFIAITLLIAGLFLVLFGSVFASILAASAASSRI